MLHTEIAERGYTGGYVTLARYLRPLRRIDVAALAALPPSAPVEEALGAGAAQGDEGDRGHVGFHSFGDGS